jgi:AcrR family transcriptional regulator
MASSSGRAAPMAREQRRAAIVGSTLALIRQHGAQVTTRQIAEAAGVAEGTIFRVFPNKDALICAATEAAFDPGPVVQQIRSVPADQPLEQRLLQAATLLQERLRSVIELVTILRLGAPPGEGSGHGPAHGRQGRAHGTSEHPRHAPDHAQIVEAIADLVRPDRDQLTCEPEQVARLMRLVCFAGSHPRIADGVPLTPQEVVGLLLDGVRAHPAPAAADPTGEHPC